MAGAEPPDPPVVEAGKARARILKPAHARMMRQIATLDRHIRRTRQRIAAEYAEAEAKADTASGAILDAYLATAKDDQPA